MNHFPNGILVPIDVSYPVGGRPPKDIRTLIVPPTQKLRDVQDFHRLLIDEQSVSRRPIYLIQDGMRGEKGVFTVHTEAICALWTTSSRAQDAKTDLPLATSGFNGTTVDGSVLALAFWKAQTNTTAGGQVVLPEGTNAVLVIPAAGTSCRIVIARA